MDSLTLQVAQRGVITLPKSIRERYRLNPGDALTLLDLDGVLVLSPTRSDLDRLADHIAQDLAERGESLESMLDALREARERYAT
jgi:AbrB family looped-hinge helix DNA binding protein